MRRRNVMQIIDSLDAGGAERVAVNLANTLPRERYVSHLCTTRHEGALASLIAPEVGRLRLERKRRFDPGALYRLVAYIRQRHVQILHAHGTSLFVAAFAALFPPRPALVWHEHLGRQSQEARVTLYRLAARRARAVIVVNQSLAAWACQRLGIPPDRVWYIPNFAVAEAESHAITGLPGAPGSRIVCVANLRLEKDHPTLLAAMADVVREAPATHLLLVGAAGDAAYHQRVQQVIDRFGLERHVSLLGQRLDVPAVLGGCDIGVLSSTSEGFPLALIEYGIAGLPAVATRVGQCAEILDDGRAGVLVLPETPHDLAGALLGLLRDPARRGALASRFQLHVEQHYGARAAIERVESVYEAV